MKAVAFSTAVIAVHMGSFAPKGTLTPLVPNSKTETCSRFNFQNLSSAPQAYWGSILYLQAVTFHCMPNTYFA